MSYRIYFLLQLKIQKGSGAVGQDLKSYLPNSNSYHWS